MSRALPLNASPMAQPHRRSPSAAAAAAAVEKETWEEALDVDDSDLRPINTPHSLSLPFLRPCTSRAKPTPPPPSAAAAAAAATARRRIPGPASSLQDAMSRRSPAAAAAVDAEAADADFLLDPWRRALQFLGEERAWEQPGIRAIGGIPTFHRALLVVGVVKSCTPNGLGNLFLTLKDPSGTVDASVHKKVLLEGNLGTEISVGCVIVLKEVVVFRPSRTACYLNVTIENVLKVLGKDCGPSSKQVISSVTTASQLPEKCTETGRVAHQGDNPTERRAATETSEGRTGIFSRMVSRTDNVGIAEVLSGNSGAANAPGSRMKMAKRISHGLESHREIGLEEMDLDPQSKKMPCYDTSQQLQKILNSMNPASWQQRQEVSSAKNGGSTAAGSSTGKTMRELLDGLKMIRSSKEATVAEVSCDHHVKPTTSNSTSRMDGGLHGKHQSSRQCDEDHQQNLSIPNTSGSQTSIGGRSGMPGNNDSIETTTNEKLSRPFDGKGIVSISKRLKRDEVLSNDGSATTYKNISISSMDTEADHGFEKHLTIGLDDVAEELHSQHFSPRKPNGHHQQGFSTANVGTVQPIQENSPASTTNATAIIGSVSSKPGEEPKKLVLVASVAEWTDEQLSELFCDY